TGYVFDQDAFPLVKTDPKGNKAVVFRFAPGKETDILTTTATDRRKVYVLGASGQQTMTIKPSPAHELPAGGEVRLYVFGEDFTVLATNEAQISNVVLPSTQKYYVTLHWLAGAGSAANATFEIAIKW
ncbi:MAG: hypothetical protein WBM66_12985, partial [Thiothrix litoralis]